MGREKVDPVFFVEHSAYLTGFDRLAAVMFDEEDYAPYLFVLAVVIVDIPVLETINSVWIVGETGPWWRWLTSMAWLIPIIAVLAVWFLRTLRTRYDRAVKSINRQQSDERIKVGFSSRVRRVALFVGLAIYFVWLWTDFARLLATEGPLRVGISFFLISPLVYVPLGAEAAAAYFQIQIVLPARIHASDLQLDFSDPHRLGGMYPVGRTMRFAALSMFVALTLYTIWGLFGFISGPESIQQATQVTLLVFFTAAWILVLLLLLIGLYLMHRFMSTRRREELKRIHGRIGEIGDDTESFPYTVTKDSAEFQEYLQEYVNMTQVERTKTVPFNILVLWELAAAAVFPVALQLLSIAL